MAATLQLSASHAPSPAAKPRPHRWSALLGGACLLGVFAIWRVVFAGSQGAAAGPAHDVTATVQAARPSSSEATATPTGAPAPGAPAVRAEVLVAPAAAPTQGAAGAEDAGLVRPSSPAQSPNRAAKPASAPAKARPLAAATPREGTKSDGAPSAGSGGDGERDTPSALAGEADDAALPSVEPSPSAAGGVAGAAEPGPDISNTTFDRQAAKAVLDAAAASARNCRPPGGLTGTGRVQVIFEPSGKVASVTLLTSRFEDTETGSCVRMVFRRVRVPAFQGAPGIVVNKSFEIPEPGDPLFRFELPRRRP